MPKACRAMDWGSGKRRRAVVGMAAMAAILVFGSQALARAAQNPIAAMISVPFQNNMNFGYGPNDHIQNVLNIQPVVSCGLNKQQPINAQLGAYYNAIRPDIGPEWQLRFQIQFLFPR